MPGEMFPDHSPARHIRPWVRDSHPAYGSPVNPHDVQEFHLQGPFRPDRAHCEPLEKRGRELWRYLHRIPGDKGADRPGKGTVSNVPEREYRDYRGSRDGGQRKAVSGLWHGLRKEKCRTLRGGGHHCAQYHRGCPDDGNGIQGRIRWGLY